MEFLVEGCSYDRPNSTVQASSNEGAVVLDPFAGCGTTNAAAQKLGRQWIGIDVTQLSIALLKNRLEGNFGLLPLGSKKTTRPESEPGAVATGFRDGDAKNPVTTVPGSDPSILSSASPKTCTTQRNWLPRTVTSFSIGRCRRSGRGLSAVRLTVEAVRKAQAKASTV